MTVGTRRIGPHVSMRHGILAAFERARSVGANTMQVFSDSPIAWQRRLDPPPGSDSLRQAMAAHDFGPLAIHAPYLVNLASPDDLVFWRSIKTLATELTTAARMGARFLNVHAGSHRGSGVDAGIRRLAVGIRGVVDLATDASAVTRIVIESSAGQGDALGASVDELALMVAAIDATGLDPSRVGICLDTAHLWAAGYAMHEPAAIDALLQDCDERIGRERLAMLHLNDSRAVRGSRRDRHDHIGAGNIGPAGLRHVLVSERLAGVPTYLETPGMEAGWDAVNMARVARLIAAGSLDPLPSSGPEC